MCFTAPGKTSSTRELFTDSGDSATLKLAAGRCDAELHRSFFRK
jgi:hypothetical protein